MAIGRLQRSYFTSHAWPASRPQHTESVLRFLLPSSFSLYHLSRRVFPRFAPRSADPRFQDPTRNGGSKGKSSARADREKADRPLINRRGSDDNSCHGPSRRAGRCGKSNGDSRRRGGERGGGAGEAEAKADCRGKNSTITSRERNG